MSGNLFLAMIGGAAVTLASPGLAHAQSTPDELAEAFKNAVVAEDKAAIAKLYTPEAISYDAGGTVSVGPTEIAGSWAGFFNEFDGFTVQLEKQGSRLKGDTNAAWGLWTMSATPVEGGDAVTWRGRYMDVAIKTKDGWRYIADHASMLLDPSATPASE